MATVLYRIGRFAFRHRLLVIAVWVLLLAGAAATTTLAKPFLTDFSLPGSESERAGDMLDEKFPAQGDFDLMAQAKVVVRAPAGSTLDAPDNAARVDALVSEIRGLPHVRQPVANPLTMPAPPGMASHVSPDRTIAYLDVMYDQKFVDVKSDTRHAFSAMLDDGRATGLTVEATGTIFNGQPPQSGASEAMGFGVALIVMVIAFASVVAASLPIITAIFGVGISVSLITGSTAFMHMDSSALLIASMIGIAVSIDYALFIVSRFRHELTAAPDDPAHAAARAVGTAGSSVVFAGLTVVIALLALGVVPVPMMSVMGYTAALAVVMAVLAAITLLPALLGMFGRRVFALRIRGLLSGDEPDSVPSNGLRWVRFVVAHPVPVLVAAVLVLGIVAVPVSKLELGMDLATGDQKKAVALIRDGFGEGVTGPLVVVIDGDEAADRPGAYAALAAAIRGKDNVAMVSPPLPNPDGSGALITVIPVSGPSSPQTQTLMNEIRGLEPSFAAKTGVQFGVAGQTAILSDMSDGLLKSLVPYLALVVGLAFLVLMLVFRSVLVPLTATLGFLLSIGATFGATVAIFQQGWLGVVTDPGPIISFLPIFLIGIVFGLAMDYQVFLVTRMREEYVHGRDARSAVVVGYQHGARVVASAAVIMISVFAAFILAPDTVAKSMGFAMAVAVLFDAFLVRMMVIPAVMALLGDKAWYLPRWLDRILPNVDIEGERLAHLVAKPAEAQLVSMADGTQRMLVGAGGGGGRHRL